MVTGGFRTVVAMNAALDSGACDFIGIARPFAVETDLANRLLVGQDVRYGVDKIKTGIPMIGDYKWKLWKLFGMPQFKAIARASIQIQNSLL